MLLNAEMGNVRSAKENFRNLKLIFNLNREQITFLRIKLSEIHNEKRKLLELNYFRFKTYTWYFMVSNKFNPRIMITLVFIYTLFLFLVSLARCLKTLLNSD